MPKVAKEDEEVSKGLQGLADLVQEEIEKLAGQKMGFALVVFNAEAGSRMNYVSNCARNEVADAFQSLLVGWKAGMPDIPAHKVN